MKTGAIIQLLHKIYRYDKFILKITSALVIEFNRIYALFVSMKNNFYFDTLDEAGILYFEELMKITPAENQTLDDRRVVIQAKWLSKIHSDIKLIQIVCNSWKNGRIAADFIDGKIQIKFIDTYGVPKDLESLERALYEIKPAHLDLTYVFKYLLKKEIHEVMTKAEMETRLKSEYCEVDNG